MKKYSDRRKELGLHVGNKKYLRGICRNNGCTEEVWSVKKEAIFCGNSCAQTSKIRMAREASRQWKTKGWENKQLVLFEGIGLPLRLRLLSTTGMEESSIRAGAISAAVHTLLCRLQHLCTAPKGAVVRLTMFCTVYVVHG